MNLSLENKLALIGGSSEGIGKGIATVLAELGATVILVGRKISKLEELLPLLDTTNGQKHHCLELDYSYPEKVLTKVEDYISENGLIVHILINNTGGPPSGKIYDATDEQLQTAFNMHLRTSHKLMKLLVPQMRSENYGRIINITSTSTQEPINNLGLSNTIRAAVANWGKTLATELASYNITVNNIMPGSTKTGRLEQLIAKGASSSGVKYNDAIKKWLDNIPMGRFAEVKEVANVVGFIASPAASYITGINLAVDGGKLKGL